MKQETKPSFLLKLLCFPILLSLICSCNYTVTEKEKRVNKPNIILILADDLGYGDLGVYNSHSKIPTPHLDKLASGGMRFTDAHSNASVCTPTRYGIMTGRYSWKSRMKKGVSWGFSPAVIKNERITLAEFVQGHSYQTACVGKWHLGLNWTLKDGSIPGEGWETMEDHQQIRNQEALYEKIDFNQKVKGGPGDQGFEYSFILPNSLDIPPYVFLENDLVISPPSDSTEGNDLNTGYTDAFWRAGEMMESFDFYKVLPTFFDKAKSFIASTKEEDPFFLYLPLASPHTPWLPTEEFVGTSEAGMYGDFVAMTDHYVGDLVDFLEKKGMRENTLIIFTSDNGPYWRPNSISTYSHKAAGPLRGMKGDVHDGGHRVPFILNWPNRIKEGELYHEPLCLTDIMATISGILGSPLPEEAGEDSYDHWGHIMTQDGLPYSRSPIIHQSSRNHFGLRQAQWKFIPLLGSGGFSPPAVVAPKEGSSSFQLYHMGDDLAESINLADSLTEKCEQMNSMLQEALKGHIDLH